MSANTAITVEQYLHTSFPGLDREYQDGEVLERTLPDHLHSRTQVLLAAFFVALERTLHLYACTELRLRLSANTIRIPDVCVFEGRPPGEPVPETPPLIVIEILSPDDRMSEVRTKLEEYRQWGVANVWLVDPHTRRMYTCQPGLTEVETLHVAPNVAIAPSAIFG